MGPILLADARNPELRAALHALRGDLELIEADAVPEALRRCTIWLGEPDRLVPLLRAGLRPQWLQSTWAGYRPPCIRWIRCHQPTMICPDVSAIRCSGRAHPPDVRYRPH